MGLGVLGGFRERVLRVERRWRSEGVFSVEFGGGSGKMAIMKKKKGGERMMVMEVFAVNYRDEHGGCRWRCCFCIAHQSLRWCLLVITQCYSLIGSN